MDYQVVAISNVICQYVENGVICENVTYRNSSCSDNKYTFGDTMFWVYLGIYVALVLLAGLMSGLTMGLLSLDVLSLKVLKSGGTAKQQKYATTILPIVEKHHLLLVTLLLGNAASVEAMPIFLDRISNPIVAVVVSVTAVLLFGEIVPQALCTRYGLAIGYYLSPLVKFLMVLLFFIAWPISKILDCLLGGEHSTFFRRAELRELVDLHGEKSEHNEEPLSSDEVLIIKGALEMRSKVVKEAMTPLESVFMLNTDDKLDRVTMQKLLDAGHSRVPVFEDVHSNIVGILLVKQIIMLDPDDAVPVRQVCRPNDNLLRIPDDMPLYDLLNKFQEGKGHMAQVWGKTDSVVTTEGAITDPAEESNNELLGIITLEDVIEELIQEEIVDETDVYVDVHRRVFVARARIERSKSVAVSEGATRTIQQRMAQKQFRRLKSTSSEAKISVNASPFDVSRLAPSFGSEHGSSVEETTPLLQSKAE
ncbi:uncharacterized protein LOC134186817 [Corticium candelabrum]|uniref:uncharacterized protein LOC134186817 n=1 Tax=Corticium candelabrum TaxID=121492 RepID=UPI002E26753C|nr:uncharacterized protein LOC134186817 [Corticium candelabrum]